MMSMSLQYGRPYHLELAKSFDVRPFYDAEE